MSPCDAFRNRILVADASTLRDGTDVGLAEHLRACPSCASAVRRILETDSALDAALSGAPPIDAAAVVARALGDARPPRASRLVPPAWVAFAVAASIAALILLPHRPPAMVGVEWEVADATPATFEAPAERNMAVITTRDPDITVLWFF